MEPVSTAIAAGSAIAGTIAGISDMAKRRRLEEAVMALSVKQQNELNKMMLEANTQTDRLNILSNAVVQFAIANQTANVDKDTKMYILAGSLAVGLLIVVSILAVKS